MLRHDGTRERVADHLHVGVGGADAVIGGIPLAGGLRVHDRLGLEHVVGDEARDRVERQPRRGGDELGELGDVLLRQLLDRLVAHRLVLGGDTRGVVHEVPVMGAPDPVERVLGVLAVDRADHGADVRAVGIEQLPVRRELLVLALQRRARGLEREQDVLAQLEVERGPQVGSRAVDGARGGCHGAHGMVGHGRGGRLRRCAGRARDEETRRESRDESRLQSSILRSGRQGGGLLGGVVRRRRPSGSPVAG
jgi:hypothetical protein